MLVIGHRGVPRWPNTVRGVRAAMAQGASGVEIDVRRTARGRLVCSHDPLVAGQRPPRVSAVLDAVRGRGRVVVEIKNVPGEPDFDAPREQTALALLQLLAERGAPRADRVRALRTRCAGGVAPASGADPLSEAVGEDVVVSSFDWFAIEAVRAAGGPPTAFLLARGIAIEAGAGYAVEAGHTELHALASAILAAPAAVRQVHAVGLRLLAWGDATPDVARRLREAGVDGVICDDVPATLRALGP